MALAVDYPVTAQSLFFLSSDTPRHGQFRRHQCSGARGQVPGLPPRVDHRDPTFIRARSEHWGRMSSESVEHLGQPRSPPPPSPTRRRAAGRKTDFSSPVAITAGTTYVASYHTNTGNYSADGNLFSPTRTQQRCTDRSVQCVERRQWGLCLWKLKVCSRITASRQRQLLG